MLAARERGCSKMSLFTGGTPSVLFFLCVSSSILLRLFFGGKHTGFSPEGLLSGCTLDKSPTKPGELGSSVPCSLGRPVDSDVCCSATLIVVLLPSVSVSVSSDAAFQLSLPSAAFGIFGDSRGRSGVDVNGVVFPTHTASSCCCCC